MEKHFCYKVNPKSKGILPKRSSQRKAFPLTHDVNHFCAGLTARLATRARHLCVLLGAGASCSAGLPTMTGLENELITTLPPRFTKLFQSQLSGRNLESTLSRIRSIKHLLADDKTAKIEAMDSALAIELDQAICKAIVTAVDLSKTNEDAHLAFAAWIGRADYLDPVEIFTTNYDLLLESTFDQKRVIYFDGFIGNIRASFHAELIDADRQDPTAVKLPGARLWKLHGSINWEWNDAQIVRLGVPVPDGQVAAIFPSDAKYEESRRIPFLVIQDRFRRSLNTQETLFLCSGYSFSDMHLNELILDAATRQEGSEFIIFCFDTIPDNLASEALLSPNLQVISPLEAIIGGHRLPWGTPKTVLPDTLWKDDRFQLTNFESLAHFLARCTNPIPWVADPTSGVSLAP